MTKLTFGDAKAGDLWISEEKDILWIISDINQAHRRSFDRIVAHFYHHGFESLKEKESLNMFKSISDEGWSLHGYEDCNYELKETNFGSMYKRTIIEYLFKIDIVKVWKYVEGSS